jgi:chromosome segregation ATPase
MSSETDGNTAETSGTGEVPASAGNTPGTPAAETPTNWQESYKGLQRSHQEFKRIADAKIAELESKLADALSKTSDLAAQGSSKDSRVAEMQTQMTSLSDQIKTLQAEKGKTDGKLARAEMILRDYPELASWEARKLLPHRDTDEETRTALADFRTALGSKVGQGVKEVMTTSTPVGSANTSSSMKTDVNESREYVWKKIGETAGIRGKEQEYNDWRAKLDALDAKEHHKN